MTKDLRTEIFEEIESMVAAKADYFSDCLKEVDRFTHSEYIMDELLDYFSDEYISSSDEDEIFTMILDEMDRVFDKEIEIQKEWVA